MKNINNKISILFILFGLMLMGNSVLVAATTVDIPTTKDTSISIKSNELDKNYGGENRLKIKIKTMRVREVC